MKKHYIAVDLGASGGRTIVGTYEDGKLSLREMNRFWNGPTEVDGTLYWDIVHLFRHIKEGIAAARAEFGADLVSLGIDTWGVDFGFLDSDGRLLGNPVNYRDRRTVGMYEKIFEKVSKDEVFARSGIQFMELNTLCQLEALSQSGAAQYAMADKLLFIPDLLNYWLTGEMKAERTFASTSQFYNPVTKDWAYDLLEKLGIRTDLFAELVDPGSVIGDMEGLPVVAVGSHDTASAFAAVPVDVGEHSAFLSSGTWSLLGTELAEPVINQAALEGNFTNEVGVCDTIRFLKNLSGMWILQEVKRIWAKQGDDYSWEEMVAMADSAESLICYFDPSDPVFSTPGDMPQRIQAYCERTGQEAPESRGDLVRACYENLALLYADTFDTMEALSGKDLSALRIVGGGTNCTILNQAAANAIGRKVLTGPKEATAIGNLITQMQAMGDIQSLEEGRAVVARSFTQEFNTYKPRNVDEWNEALSQWRQICR